MGGPPFASLRVLDHSFGRGLPLRLLGLDRPDGLRRSFMAVQHPEVLLQNFANLPRSSLRGGNLLGCHHCNGPGNQGIHMSAPRLVKGGKGH